VTRSDLFEHLHDEADTPISNLVDVHIFYLRKKLGADFIVTHRGQGYSIPA
jgi:two-component system OmpR family response regulator